MTVRPDCHTGYLHVATRHTLPGMSSPELVRRVDAHGEDLRAISDTVIEIRDDLAEVKTEHGRLLVEHSVTLAEHSVTLAEHSVTLGELNSKLDAVLALLAPGKDG